MTGRLHTSESIEVARAELAARLRHRVLEIENAILARIRGLPESVDEEPAYVAGLQRAVAAALTYGLKGIEEGAESVAPIPPEAIGQARRAAREGVGMDTVLRRYAAGNMTLEEFIVAEADGVPRPILCQILSEQGPHIDRLMKAVSAEFQEELAQTRRSTAERQSDRILRLLKGASAANPADLAYNFDAWHVGVVLVGAGAESAIYGLADVLGCQSLSVVREHEITWAWLGQARRSVLSQLEGAFIEKAPADVSVAIGEPRKGLDGWRQTHLEALAAFQVMLHRPNRMTRCRDVILISAIVRDQSLVASLIETYLAPLKGQGNSAEVLRETLRAYFKADQNAASAAASLGVARQTVDRRLRSIEERLGQRLNICNAQLRIALSVEELVAPRGGA